MILENVVLQSILIYNTNYFFMSITKNKQSSQSPISRAEDNKNFKVNRKLIIVLLTVIISLSILLFIFFFLFLVKNDTSTQNQVEHIQINNSK